MVRLVSFLWVAVCLGVFTVSFAIAQNDPPTPTTTTVPTTQPEDENVLLRLMRGDNQQLDVNQLADVKFWLDFSRDAIFWIVGFIPRVISATVLLLIFYGIYRIVRKIIKTAMAAGNVDNSIRDMLIVLVKWAILGFGLIIAGNQIGLQIAALLTGVSIIGLAVGFAAQESLSNFISGIMIFIDKPFKVGDWVQVDGHLGQVRRVTFRSTRLCDLDGDIVVMPNVAMLSHKVINKSANPITRAKVMVGIAYKESIDRARDVLMTMIKKDARIEKTPEPEVVVVNLNASSVDLMVHFWIKEERYEDAMQYEYMERCKEALDEAGIEIPFPHMQVVMPSAKAG